MNSELEGKVALITGSTKGIGKGIALVLAEKGADIVINAEAIDDEAQQLADRIKAMGRKVIIIKADVRLEKEVKDLFDQIIEKFGQLDILVNNAGTNQPKDIFETELVDWQRIIDTNLTSTFLCSRQAMKIMANQKSGRIICISSVVGERGALFGHVHYASSKSGILGFVKTLARTGAPLGINVNAVAPGLIGTELLFQTHGEEQVNDLAKSIPLGLGTPRQVGLAVAYLAGEGGDYITGATIDINGGANFR
ncbi:3-oxoacyl-ACP reductase family protein [Dyadobacter sp. LHD-138]|uniref:SDR family NAD(P)-dependent oxidoreductase n=1 Tax=Dyadobacter sp. LHD-138 TaxID=3071413 RepID=UPI0027DFFF83|nr:3-oxoacyl-ACP reductase family protein [Dyadobacter sp. LHD-138]MDQ6481687.1 3-oxoacyl-ACP reductase family protein [Dyadobacter sp. LHD-138]